jgi:hypothetical protein
VDETVMRNPCNPRQVAAAKMEASEPATLTERMVLQQAEALIHLHLL